MNNMSRIFVWAALMLLAQTQVMAQGTVDDYKRAFAIRGKYSHKMAGGDVKAHMIRGGHKFWYSVWDGKNTVYKEVDADICRERDQAARWWKRYGRGKM